MRRFLRRLLDFIMYRKLMLAATVLVVVVVLAVYEGRGAIELVPPLINPRFSSVQVAGELDVHYDSEADFSFVMLGTANALKSVKHRVIGSTLHVTRQKWNSRYEKMGFSEFFRLAMFSIYYKRTNGFPFLSIRFSTNPDKQVKVVIGKNVINKVQMTGGGKFFMENYSAEKVNMNFIFNGVQRVEIEADLRTVGIALQNTSSLVFNGTTKVVSFYVRGAGEAYLAGESDRMVVNLGEDFTFRADNMATEALKVVVGKNSRGWVNVSKRIDATVKDNGFLAYSGEAEVVIDKVYVNGEVLKR